MISHFLLKGCFHVGVRLGDVVHMSEGIPVSDEEVGAQRYRNDLGRTLFIDSWAHIPVFANAEGAMRVRKILSFRFDNKNK